MRKKLTAVAVVILALAAASYFFYSRKDQGNAVVGTSGIVEGTEVNLSSKVSGRISEICCNEGDDVKEGQIVIRLESDDLNASFEQAVASIERAKAELKAAESAVENSKANIRNTEADIKSAEADVEKARAQMDEAKKELVRAEALGKEELVSKSFYDQKYSAYETSVAAYKSSEARLNAAISKKDSAIAQYNSALSQVNSSKAKIRESEAGLLFSRAKLNDTVIIAPVSGIVIFKSSEKGETVAPGAAIMTIVDINNLYVRADVEETLVGKFVLGSGAVVYSGGKVFRGRVSEIGRYAAFATQRDVTRGRQDIKTFRVKIAVENHDGMLKPGQTVEVEIPKK